MSENEMLEEIKSLSPSEEAILTMLIRYQNLKAELKKEKEKNKEAGVILGKRIKICNEFQLELEKEKEKNKEAYRKANNYLYFNDSADYEVALWEVIRKLRPDLAEKWDNGEDVDLEYIEEE